MDGLSKKQYVILLFALVIVGPLSIHRTSPLVFAFLLTAVERQRDS
jgi:hypothetical protein